MQEHYYICYLDSSFELPNRRGAAYLIFLKEELIRYEIICKTDAVSAFQMEAIALLGAVAGSSKIGN